MTNPAEGQPDWLVFGLSGGFILLFVIVSLTNIELVTKLVDAAFAFANNYFGAVWQVLLLAIWVISVILAFSKYGSVRMGNLDTPEVSTFRWISMIMCALLAGGGVFWSTAEPMYHFLSVPPTFPGIESATRQAVAPALAQCHLHWGFLAWGILGTLATIVLMYVVHDKNMPLKPRALLYPILGEKGVRSFWGTIADASAIVAVAAGTIGPIGFLGLQLSYALQAILGIPDVYSSQLGVITVITVIFTAAAATGIYKGINFLSQFNVKLAISLMAFIMIIGPGRFIFDAFLSSFGLYIQDFVRISLFRDDTKWLGWWTVFYWGWFMGYGPMMAIFTARISRGRTIREIILAVAIIAPIVTNFWFSVLGGAGIHYELLNPGSVSTALNESGLPAALIAIVNQLPMANIIIYAFILLVVLFLVTTGAGMTFSIAVSVTGEETPPIWVRVFWGVMMGAMAAILIAIGDGGIKALQSFIIVTAIPVGFFLVPMLWAGPKYAAALYKAQNQGDTNPVGAKAAGKTSAAVN
ncbi:BCCT family transporter [Desulfonema ishimotonii]|uniref:BCCT family transporter n=1 Tax=Desulfonema ishimotonii TaxID=45657 RepID=A0A401FQX9_9BACT|nr:BCCT family transporter [Desulfonema ishimotonii]GBC59369.1 BCCT family transporter [Desulfonema ishimotonii]